jgi:hypothetical protein
MKKKPKQQAVYRIRNWSEYNKALMNRGSLTVWFDPAVAKEWTATDATGKPGRPQLYSNVAILTALTLAAVFHLPLRQTVGFLRSVLDLMKLALPAPDYTTLSRRRSDLDVPLAARERSSKEPLHVVVDSTGLKVFGEGEWKVRQHGYSKRRTWRKLHLAIDEATGDILAEELTENSTHDGAVLLPLLEQIHDPIGQVSADGAYDSHEIHNHLKENGINAAIPPRRGSRTKKHGNEKGERLGRDEAVRGVRNHGRKRWKVKVGYHRRSLAETAMFRIKTIFGSHLSARILDAQKIEARLRCHSLNVMTALGMPNSVLVT